MPIDQLNNAWAEYRAQLLRFYTGAGAEYAIDDGRPLDPDSQGQAGEALDGAGERSQELREIADGLLARGEDDYDEVAVRLIAAAAVDCMVSYHALLVDPEPVAPNPALAERAAEVELERWQDVVRAADSVFQGEELTAGGQDVGPEELHAECTEGLQRLIDSAATPALRFSFGAVTVGMATASEAVAQLAGLAKGAGPIRRRALGFLGEGVRKLVSATGYENAIDKALDPLRGTALRGGTVVLGQVVGRAKAETRVTVAFDPAAAWDDPRIDRVRGGVLALTAAYARQMQWTGRVASFIAHASPLIATLAAPIGGPLVVVALDGVGIGFVVYTLGVRLDDHWLPLLPARVDGLVTIVERLDA